MDDCISRKQAIDAVKNYWKSEVDALHTNPKYADFNEHTEACDSILTHNANICKALEKLPSAQPVRKGRWIKLDMHAHLADHKCTACGQECYVPTCMGEPMYTYCPNCGADMRQKEGSENGENT